jgi:hypothetical protein
MILHMIFWLLFSNRLIAAPGLTHHLQAYPYERAFELTKLNLHRYKNTNFIDKARMAAIRFHDAAKDDSVIIKIVMDSKPHFYPKKNDHIMQLIRNPTVDLSAFNNLLAKTLLDDKNIVTMALLVNNSRIDLSFDDNYLLKEAQGRQNHQMTALLMYDSNIRKHFAARQEESDLRLIQSTIETNQNELSDFAPEQMPQDIESNMVPDEPEYVDDDQDLSSKGATILSSANPEELISVDINDISLDDVTTISESDDDLKNELGWVDIDSPPEEDWITVGNSDEVSSFKK